MKVAYDLHIHSVLSPCADELMTPNNILNMAMLKGLNMIAITDHNSTKQLPVIKELAESYDFIIIPGVEVTVTEGFDVLCYFRTWEDAYQFDHFLEQHLCNEWGSYSKENQVITDIYDTTISYVDQPLTKTSITFQELYREVKSSQGAVVLAHINRRNSSALNTYTLDQLDFDGIELQIYQSEQFLEQNPFVSEHKLFYNSDSHSLLQLSESEYEIDIEDLSIEGFFQYLVGYHG